MPFPVAVACVSLAVACFLPALAILARAADDDIQAWFMRRRAERRLTPPLPTQSARAL